MFWNFRRTTAKKRAYFDYASATPLDPRVLKAMMPWLKTEFANASALYKEGVVARKAIEEARRSVAHGLQSKPEEIIFTSGGTEANNMAILGTYLHCRDVLKKERIHFVTTSIEHSSVLEAFEHIRGLGAKVTYVSPEENGIVDAKKVEEAVRPETVLVSVMYANNEIGTVQPIRDIGRLVKAKNPDALFHSDACQAGSYLTLLVNDLYVDLLTLDASKIYGPKGTGVLFKKRSVTLQSIVFGGGQEAGLRSGTEHVAGIVGFAKALTIAQSVKKEETRRIMNFRSRILHELLSKVPELKINGDMEQRLPNNLNICLVGLDAEYAVLRMDALGYALSSVTSCRTLSEDSSSYVIEELYKDASCSKSSLRITLGRFTTEKEIQGLVEALLTVLKR